MTSSVGIIFSLVREAMGHGTRTSLTLVGWNIIVPIDNSTSDRVSFYWISSIIASLIREISKGIHFYGWWFRTEYFAIFGAIQWCSYTDDFNKNFNCFNLHSKPDCVSFTLSSPDINRITDFLKIDAHFL